MSWVILRVSGDQLSSAWTYQSITFWFRSIYACVGSGCDDNNSDVSVFIVRRGVEMDIEKLSFFTSLLPSSETDLTNLG